MGYSPSIGVTEPVKNSVKVGSHMSVRGCPVPDVTDQESDEISQNGPVVVRGRLDRTRGVHINVGGSIGHLVKITVVMRPAQYAEAIRTVPRWFIEHAKTDAFWRTIVP
uniref:Uncharacterized protein n=1 Tax=Hyaloperonospora arabidopsidis (strain Emoy2) TaxID=559515 RepID=M4BWI8_HYAAE